jgi:homoaconitase/3-isopropylmalate dehydratase large subunit
VNHPATPAAGMTMIDKILARHAGLDRVAPGEIVVCDGDLAVRVDLEFSIAGMDLDPKRIADPERIAVVLDHAVPAPGAELLRRLGIRALVAESVNDLFYRNCVNYALPLVECRGVTNVVREVDVVRVGVAEGTIQNLDTGQIVRGARMPKLLLDVIAAGGLLPRLRAQGYL